MRISRKNGSEYEGSDYYINLSINGTQIKFTLDSANKEIAADKALEIWHYLKANGGQATLEKYKSDSEQLASDPTKE